MAGAMQPIGMILMVLQRRLQAPVPDLQAIAKNVASIDSLTKEAMAGGLNAMGWLTPREDPALSVRRGVEEIVELLAVELASNGLEPVNEVAEDAPGAPVALVAPQEFFRSVVAGALLAMCDGGKESGKSAGAALLHMSLEGDAAREPSQVRLMLRRMPNAAAVAEPMPLPKARPIGWDDVKAMAAGFGAEVTHGEGWVALSLPGPN
jgi:hypothetical protein